MKLQKRYLQLLYVVTKGTEGVLTLSEGRKRDLFMKTLHDVTVQYETDKKAILDKFCEKVDGVPDIADGKYRFNEANTALAEAEIKTLNDEEVELPTVEGIKDILERTKYSPLIGETEAIDTILSKF